MNLPIKNQVWNYRMRKLLSGHRPASRRYISMQRLRTAAVMFPADDEKEYKLAMSFIKDLLKKQIQVRALAVARSKSRPPHWQPSLYVNYLTYRDVSWDGRPKRSHLQDFSEAEVDMFIDLNYKPEKPVMYLAATSKAKLRIGPSGPGHAKYYDLMIDTRKLTTLEQYLGQIIHYLSTIKAVE